MTCAVCGRLVQQTVTSDVRKAVEKTVTMIQVLDRSNKALRSLRTMSRKPTKIVKMAALGTSFRYAGMLPCANFQGSLV